MVSCAFVSSGSQGGTGSRALDPALPSEGSIGAPVAQLSSLLRPRASNTVWFFKSTFALFVSLYVLVFVMCVGGLQQMNFAANEGEVIEMRIVRYWMDVALYLVAK